MPVTNAVVIDKLCAEYPYGIYAEGSFFPPLS